VSAAARDYRDKAVGYLAAQGARPITLEKQEAPRQWQEWVNYFRYLGMKGSAEMMAMGSTWTVPALSPHDFDPTVAAEADRVASQVRPSRPASGDITEKTARLLAKWRPTAAHITDEKARRASLVEFLGRNGYPIARSVDRHSPIQEAAE
jgi:hypothetical protein